MVASTAEQPVTALTIVRHEPAELLEPICEPAHLVTSHQKATRIIAEVLEEGVDYGTIPGAGRTKVLKKPGAERLRLAFGLDFRFITVEMEKDHDRTVFYVKDGADRESFGLYRYVIKCVLSKNGRDVGEADASCSTLESKYISRPRDCDNTVLKMAEKRAFIGAILFTLGMSNRFTQDIEEGEEEDRPRQRQHQQQSKPKQEIDQAVKEAEAKAAAAKRDAAVTYLHHFCDRIDAVSVLKDGATEEDRKGAFEAFMMVLDEEKAKMDELAAAAPKFHLALKVLETVVGAHLSGMETKLSDQDKAAYEWLQKERANRPAVTKESAA